jgi:hypothetical protein
MFFTITHYERNRGLEFCCDTCNKRFIEEWNGAWWYVRYNVFDEHPALWICNSCKEELE